MSYSLVYSRQDRSWAVRDGDRGVIVETHPSRESALASVQRLNAPEYDALEAFAESALIPEITEDILNEIEPLIREIAREGIETAEDLVSAMQRRKAVGSREINGLVDKFIRNYRTKWSENISDSTRGIVRDTLARGRKNGWRTEDVISAVEQQGFGSSRARTIAVTETTEIYGQAAVSHYNAMGVQEWQWQTVKDFAVDPDCAERQGQRFPVSQPFQPAHPNCRCFASPVPLPEGQQPPEHYQSPFAGDPRLDSPAGREELSLTDDYAGLVESDGPLTEDMFHGVRKYKGSDYIKMNGGLRGQFDLDPDDMDNIRFVDDAISQQRLSQNTNLYRAPGEDFWESMGGGPLNERVIGTEIKDHGYLSTSVAESFAKSWNLRTGGRAPIMEIRAPKGQNATLMNKRPDGDRITDGEMEVLLPRSTKFRVADIDRERNTMILEIVRE